MPYACDHCGQKTEPEPGFYYGAMIVSYVLSIFLIFPVGLFMIFYVGWSINAGMAFIIFLSLISFIRILRYSRAIWLHLLVKYDPKYK